MLYASNFAGIGNMPHMMDTDPCAVPYLLTSHDSLFNMAHVPYGDNDGPTPTFDVKKTEYTKDIKTDLADAVVGDIVRDNDAVSPPSLEEGTIGSGIHLPGGALRLAGQKTKWMTPKWAKEIQKVKFMPMPEGKGLMPRPYGDRSLTHGKGVMTGADPMIGQGMLTGWPLPDNPANRVVGAGAMSKKNKSAASSLRASILHQLKTDKKKRRHRYI